MSYNNCIINLLEIKEEKVIFDTIFMENREINGKRCHVFKGYLYNDVDSCPKCGCINDNSIIKKSTKICNIKMNKTSEVITFLELRKQVYYCKNCKKKFIASTKIVNKGCSISNNVKNSVFCYCKNPMSKKLIGELHNVSDNTVQNIINEKMTKEKLYKNYLPECICFDEFTYKKNIFAFNMCDASTGKLIDLVEDRSTQNLEKYFSYYSKECREKVKLIIIDMYSPYMELIKKWFPNAKIIIDLFRIVQLLTKSLNKTRIDIMKANKEYQTKFERYWRLILT